MSTAASPPPFDRETMRKLPTEQLVEIIWQQQHQIEQLRQEIERLKVSLQLNSQNSSKPPSSDLLKKPQTPKASSDKTSTAKSKPGGQPGHPGKTRKGFGRVDRYEVLRPQLCLQCGSQAFAEVPVGVQVQQVAQLVERPIEIVEYQQHSCQCLNCDRGTTAAWPVSIVPGQDLGVSLQALLVWLGNYARMALK